jgi:hypothetical protein
MARITIHFPDAIVRKARSAARACHEPLSQWIADQLSQKFDNTWPQEVLDAAEAFRGFPGLEQICNATGEDSARESLERRYSTPRVDSLSQACARW